MNASQRRIAIFFAVVAVTGAALLLSVRPEATDEPDPDAVAATLFPIYDIVRNVAPADVEVHLLLPPGASPHTFEPTPRSLRKMGSARALYAVGHGLDGWAADLAEAVPGVEVVTVDRNVELRRHEEETEEHDEAEDDAHGHGDADPHYWLSLKNGMEIARTVANDLKTRFPDRQASIDRHLAEYLDELRQADADVRSLLDGMENRQMVTLHDAWYYFTEEYGLDVVATFEPAPGREPTPQYLAALGHAVSTSGVSTVYSEPQLSTDVLRPFLEDHGLTLAELDPLGSEELAPGYIEMMLFNARTIRDNQ